MPEAILARVYLVFYTFKIQIISPGLIFVQKAFSLVLFSEGLVIGRNFAFQNGFGLSIKTAKNTKKNSSKQLTVIVHREGYLGLRFGGGGGGGLFLEGLIIGILRYFFYLLFGLHPSINESRIHEKTTGVWGRDWPNAGTKEKTGALFIPTYNGHHLH